MQVGEGREYQCVSTGQRVQDAVAMKLCATTLVLIGVEGNHHADVGALVVMPRTFLLILGVIVCNLNLSWIRSTFSSLGAG